ncbi:MAG: tryptophan--tRNA ligase [Armatimonadota bacterium]
MRALSGIQPSGALHIGNYLAALKQYIALQDQHEGFYFLADYHALTTIRDPDVMRRYTMSAAIDFLACGLDPERSVLFKQSDVPEVTELTWLLSCVTPMGLLERCHAYKEKVADGASAEHGLFAYPVLMAADILIYDSDIVPVGQDQKQHVEVTRDIAARFNNTFGETLKLPEPHIVPSVATVPGLDGRKMSKSYGNTIEIFADEETTRKRVMSIVTDSTPLEAPKDPDKCNVMALYRLFASDEEVKEMEERYRAGGYGYGDAKKELARVINEYFRPMRERRPQLEREPDYVRDVLSQGARRARSQAQETLARARAAAGYV